MRIKGIRLVDILAFGISLLFLIPMRSFGQKMPQDIDRLFSIAEAKEDLRILKEQLYRVHTGLFTYTPKEEFDGFFDELEDKLTEPIRSIDFYRLIFPLNKIIKNGHTRFMPEAVYMDGVLGEWPVFPFEVYWDKGNLYVLKNYSANSQIKEGSIIEEINGAKASDVFTFFKDQIWRDGYNETAPQTDAYEIFDEWYAYLKGVPKDFDLLIEYPTSEKHKIRVQGVSRNQKEALKKSRYPLQKEDWHDTEELALELDIQEPIAIMSIRSFSAGEIKDRGQQFSSFYKNSFQAIQQAGIEHLIIDLRSNWGGDPKPCMDLFSYLHDEPFLFYKQVSSNVQEIPKDVKYYSSFYDKLAVKVAFKKKGETHVPNWIAKVGGLKGLSITKPLKPTFKGDVYVLTNASSFSATGEMISILKQYDRATFIGEEAGGSPHLNTSGTLLLMELPNTQVRMVMPFWSFEMNVDFGKKGYGVMPDYPIRPSIQDMLTEKDTVMNYTLDLIQQKMNP